MSRFVFCLMDRETTGITTIHLAAESSVDKGKEANRGGEGGRRKEKKRGHRGREEEGEGRRVKEGGEGRVKEG